MSTSPAEKAAFALAKIRRALEKTTNLEQIVGLHLEAEELLLYIRTPVFGRNLLYRAAELKLRIERKGGKMLPDLHLRGGDRKSTAAAGKLTLRRRGLCRNRSAEWQVEALLPENEFAAYIRRAVQEGKEPTSHGLYDLARMHVEREKLIADSPDATFDRVARRLQSLADQRRRFGCIYIDAPWAAAGHGRASGSHLDPRLAQLPLLEVAAPQAHLYLKVASHSRKDGVKKLRGWGFSCNASLQPSKASVGPDDVRQLAREVWLLGIRDGSGCPIGGLARWIAGDMVLTGDSAEAVYRFMERESRPPYLDLFGDRPFSKLWTMAAN
jgi:hypothetical protein